MSDPQYPIATPERGWLAQKFRDIAGQIAEAGRGTRAVASLLGDFKAGSSIAGGTDLDSLTATGQYHQGTAGNATLALHYPLAGVGGMLVVEAGTTFIAQTYTTRPSSGLSRVFRRAKFSTNAWSAWAEMARAPVVDVQVDSTARSVGTTYALGPTFSTVSGFRAGSKFKLDLYVPMRNRQPSWGGGYVEPQISINGGTWQSLGSNGYSAVMVSGTTLGSIGYAANTILVDPAESADYTVRVRLYFKGYDGTLEINTNNNVNNVSGTAPIMAGVNGTQFYTRVILEEVMAA